MGKPRRRNSPPPWKADKEYPTSIGDIRAADGKRLTHPGRSKEERLANVRLIVAASIGYELAAEVMNFSVHCPNAVLMKAGKLIAMVSGRRDDE